MADTWWRGRSTGFDMTGLQRLELPISLVAHHVFCPRRAWLEAMGEQTDTYQMAVGIDAHRRSDDPAASRPQQLRAVDIRDETNQLTGRCDVVEVRDGALRIVEYKSTPVRRRAVVAPQTAIQVALQAIALRASGKTVSGGSVRFVDHDIEVDVSVGPKETAVALGHVNLLRSMLATGVTPKPLVDDPRCRSCSHAEVCLPDERRLEAVTRRVLVSDPDALVVHISTPGARAALRSGRIRVVKRDDELGSFPVERVQALVCHGNVDLSGALIRELLWNRVPVVWCSSNGRVVGWASSADSPNGGPRVRQHVLSESGHLGIARPMIAAKVANQATLLRRQGISSVAAELRSLQRLALAATSITDLFGVEGDAAARYFGAFSGMLNSEILEWVSFEKRTRRPAQDPLNACLNLAYGLLLADVIRAVVSCGLDPHAGFLHSSGRNKPALALDLAEEFRAPVADSTVIGALNNGEVRSSSFSTVTGVPRLRDSGRRALIAAYERRVRTEFKHPLFGYSVTWRRAMEIQARLVLGVIDGTQPSYRGITIR